MHKRITRSGGFHGVAVNYIAQILGPAARAADLSGT